MLNSDVASIERRLFFNNTGTSVTQTITLTADTLVCRSYTAYIQVRKWSGRGFRVGDTESGCWV